MLISKNSTHNKLVFHAVIAIALLFVVLILGVTFGAEKLLLSDIFSNEKSVSKTIFFNIRLPRVIQCCLCGMLLAGAGCVFQGFFRNPLADSGIIGISSGATLGAVLSAFIPTSFQLFGLNPIVIFAFAGALGAAFLVYVFSSSKEQNNTVMMLLVGTALATFLSSIVSILLLLHYKELHKIFVWTLGSFNGSNWKEFRLIIIPAIISFCFLSCCTKPLDALTGGEESAQSLGVNIKRTRLITLFAGSLACACAVSVAGTIGFVGLIAPHIARKLYGSRHKTVLFFSSIWGAILLVFSDTLARTIASPTEIPIGIVTSLLGVPFFILVLKNKKANL